jgi:serine/threonine protein kinase
MLEEIIQEFKTSCNTIHKARNEIKIVSFKNKNYVVKAFKIPNFINKIVYTFFKSSKAKKSYDNSIKIQKYVPKAIGYKEYYKFGLLHDSYFVSEEFKYDFTIREPLLEDDFIDKDNILRAFARFTYELHQDNILHLDYSPGNILIKKENKNYIFKIVDINRMKFQTLTLDERLKNFAKLWAKDEDLRVIIDEYAKIIQKDKKELFDIAYKYSQAHKDKQNFKKRLKGKKVVD